MYLPFRRNIISSNIVSRLSQELEIWNPTWPKFKKCNTTQLFQLCLLIRHDLQWTTAYWSKYIWFLKESYELYTFEWFHRWLTNIFAASLTQFIAKMALSIFRKAKKKKEKNLLSTCFSTTISTKRLRLKSPSVLSISGPCIFIAVTGRISAALSDLIYLIYYFLFHLFHLSHNFLKFMELQIFNWGHIPYQAGHHNWVCNWIPYFFTTFPFVLYFWISSILLASPCRQTNSQALCWFRFLLDHHARALTFFFCTRL